MTIIQHKRGTSTNWTASDPILAVGEIGYETDTGKFKIGDGTSVWSALSYFEVASGAGSGTVTSITAGTGLSGGTITTSGTIALSHLGIESLTDPNADRILFWDDSASSAQWLTLGTNLSISGTTINATDTNTTYTAGTGLTLSGTEFSVTANTYQPLDADLTAIAALSANGLLRKTAGTWGMDTATYLTSYTETDTLSDVTGRGATTNTAISITNATSSTNTTTGALKVTGGVGIQENLNVGGNVIVTGDLTVKDLTVNGTTTTINSTIVTVDDPIFTLGGDTAPGSDDNKDRGIAFRWHNGVSAKIGFFGFDDSTQYFTFVPDATITSEVISGSTGTISANLNGNATSANTLSTARNIWGQSFDGSADVTGSLTSVSDITSSDTTFSIGTTSATTVSGNAIAITGGTTSNTVGTGGSVSLTAGSATSSTGANFGGNVNIAAGASTLSASGTGGSVSILAGNGNTKGTISIGTSNTSGITIGASGITTTIVGTLSATLNALTISSPLSGTSYNGSSAVSIGLSSGYGDTQNPYAAKAIKTFLAGPAGGVSGSPTFRVLETTDIPDLSGTYVAVSGGTAPISDQVKTVANGTNASFYPTFVDANNGTATAESIYTDAGLVYNPSSNTLTVGGNLVVGGVSIQVEGATADSFETLLTVTDPTADRTITFPDATGTVALTSDISGFVTSVTGTSPVSSSGGTTPAISLASGYGDTQNPYGSKTTNYVLAGPAGGPSAAPTFRALVSGDIPDLSGTYLVVGGNATTATTATNANNINISTTDGNTSDTTMYPVFVGANTTGNQLPHTDVSGFSYNASTNAISTGSISLTGALSAVTTITGISGTTLAISAGGTSGTASSLTGGANTSTTGVGGAVSITGGAATVGTSVATGGSVSIIGGASNTTAGIGGDVTINAGLGSSANGNGAIYLGSSNTDSINIGTSGKLVNFVGAVDLRAGGTTANTAPLYFSSSTDLLSIPVAGAVEYNNANFFATPFTTSGRGLIESNYFYSNVSSIAIAGTSSGGASVSGSAFGVALPLATSTAYQIEATLYLQTSYSTNAPAAQTMTFSYPTGTTILAEGIIVQNQAAVTTQTTAGSFYAMQANTNRTITAVTTSGNWHRVSMRGIIRTSTNAGSFSINFGGTNGATPATLQLTLGANSYIKLTPVGSSTTDNNIGAWA